MSITRFKTWLLCCFCIFIVIGCSDNSPSTRSAGGPQPTDDPNTNTNPSEPSPNPSEQQDLYVSVDNPVASDSNSGGKTTPLQTIQAAMAKLAGATVPMTVHVAIGSYHVNYQTGTVIRLAKNMSLKGGYALDWSDRNPISYATKIIDDSTTGGSYADPNRVIEIDPLATNTSVIDGFEIHAGGGEYSVGIFSMGPNEGAIINANTIYAGRANLISWGIRVGDSSVTENRVYGNNLTDFYGIEASGLIQTNTVQSQRTVKFIGITGRRSSMISQNKVLVDIIPPTVSTTSNGIGIYHSGCCSVNIQNNTVTGTNMHGIYIIYADPYVATISGNTISNSNSSTCSTTGISIIQSRAAINSNNIQCAQGVYGENIGDSTISNNNIQCGNRGSSYGIRVWVPENGGKLAGTPSVTNNTISACQTPVSTL